MASFLITKDDLDEDNYYIGESLSAYDGNIIAEPGLGKIKFKHSVKAEGFINFPEMTGMDVDGDIIAGESMSVGCGIIATGDIKAAGIVAGSGIVTNKNLYSRGYVTAGRSVIVSRKIMAESMAVGENLFAGRGIDVQGDIDVGRGISSNAEIKATGDITAKSGITAGLFIECQNLSSGVQIFAGIFRHRTPTREETQIRVRNLCQGTIAHGDLILSGQVPVVSWPIPLVHRQR